MSRRIVVCLDGISWDYIEAAHTPFIDRIANKGTAKTCQAMVPTVTNVNNASIITASFPETHGITSNWYYDEKAEREVYMDSSKYLKHLTILEEQNLKGRKTLLLTVKDKLRRLLVRVGTHSYSLEKPTSKIVKELGPPPDIYSLESSPWILEAASYEIQRSGYDEVFISTTDYIPHKHAPGEEESRKYVSRIDETLQELYEPGIRMGIVADHGMNSKRVNIDLVKILLDNGIKSRFVASIKDEHIVHHSNLGGSAYLYLPEKAETGKEILSEVEGVEEVSTRHQAAKRYRLDYDRIGDLLVLADKDHTFGPNKNSHHRDIEIRSHGSLHERMVPFITTSNVEEDVDLYNKDIFRFV